MTKEGSNTIVRILCIEDEPDILRDIADELRAQGYQVDEAPDAAVAMRCATANPPDLILCDVQMPGMSGIDFLEKLRQRSDRLGTTPFILLTAFGDRDHMLQGRKAGADDYLVKPVDYDLLTVTVSTHLKNAARRTSQPAPSPVEKLAGRPELVERLKALVGKAELAVFSVDNPNELIRRLGQRLEDYLVRMPRRAELEGKIEFFHLEGFDFAVVGTGAPGILDKVLPRLIRINVRDRTGLQTLQTPLTSSIASSAVLEGDPNALIGSLASAMHLVQSEGGGRQIRLDDPQLALLRTTRTLRAQILPAIAKGEFQLHYQPRIRLSDNRVVGAEALLRWTSPEFGPISAELAISISERAGIIRQLSDWVFTEMARAQRRLVRQGHTIRLGVNVSATEFDDDLLPRILHALAAEDATPNLVDVEITETALVNDIDKTCRVARALQDSGMTVAVDDFGTGYSSLSYIGQLPINTIKIDRSFVQNIERDHAHRQIVTSIVDLTRSLGMDSVAEGVETIAQRNWLSKLGCNAVQGYLTGAPMPLDDFIAYLERGDPLD